MTLLISKYCLILYTFNKTCSYGVRTFAHRTFAHTDFCPHRPMPTGPLPTGTFAHSKFYGVGRLLDLVQGPSLVHYDSLRAFPSRRKFTSSEGVKS